ncbi:unnamed protein product [Peniophora sp. CBMAI 1063]|nr:unnamed protein product [Peniophora sp. CBMAI 1063]
MSPQKQPEAGVVVSTQVLDDVAAMLEMALRDTEVASGLGLGALKTNDAFRKSVLLQLHSHMANKRGPTRPSYVLAMVVVKNQSNTPEARKIYDSGVPTEGQDIPPTLDLAPTSRQSPSKTASFDALRKVALEFAETFLPPAAPFFKYDPDNDSYSRKAFGALVAAFYQDSFKYSNPLVDDFNAIMPDIHKRPADYYDYEGFPLRLPPTREGFCDGGTAYEHADALKQYQKEGKFFLFHQMDIKRPAAKDDGSNDEWGSQDASGSDEEAPAGDEKAPAGDEVAEPASVPGPSSRKGVRTRKESTKVREMRGVGRKANDASLHELSSGKRRRTV